MIDSIIQPMVRLFIHRFFIFCFTLLSWVLCSFLGAASYDEDFTNGIPIENWEYYSSGQWGRIEVNGQQQLTMDATAPSYNLNEAIWTVDLSNNNIARLNFYQERVSDDVHHLPPYFYEHRNGDGVAISNDGIKWYTLISGFSLYDPKLYTIDLIAARESIRRDFDSDFDFVSDTKIKFQQYDNGSIPTDGRIWDEISIDNTPSLPDLIFNADDGYLEGTAGNEGYLTASVAPLEDLSVAISSSGSLTMPEVLTLPAGETQIYFTFDIPDDSDAQGVREVIIKASADGYDSVEKTLSIYDDESPFAVTFDLNGKAIRVGGGALVQNVAYGEDAIRPDVQASTGWLFTGWSSGFANIKSDLTVVAQYATFSEILQDVVVQQCESAVFQCGVTDLNVSFQWYQGDAPDTSNPIVGATGSILITPPLWADEQYWVRVTSSYGSIDSKTVAADVIAPQPGLLWAVGTSEDGQFGNGGYPYQPFPHSPIQGAVQVAAGDRFSMVLKKDGTLWSMGSNLYGQLGDGSTIDRQHPIQIASGVKAIAAGSTHSLFIKNDGTLWGMGANNARQLGVVSSSKFVSPVQIDSNVRAVSAGRDFSVYLKNDDTLWGMGNSSYGQLGENADIPFQHTPTQLEEDVRNAAAGYSHTIFINRNGELWGMGRNNDGQLGDGTTSDRTTPIKIDTDVVALSAKTHSLYIKSDGSLWGMGSNADSKLIEGGLNSRVTTPKRLANDVIFTAAGQHHTLFITKDHTLWTLGRNEEGQLGEYPDGGLSYHVQRRPVSLTNGVMSAVGGSTHTLFIKSDGRVFAMGSNANGELGAYNVVQSSVPIIVAGNVIKADGGSYLGLSAFIKDDGDLWVMGKMLGGGSDNLRAAQEVIDSKVATLSVGGNHLLYINDDGVLYGLGSDGNGQLGIGSGSFQSQPVAIETDVIACAAGESHSLFLKSNGSLWVMGRNHKGQLGLGDVEDRAQPVLLLHGVSAILSGDNHSLFIKTDGKLYGMGDNSFDQLGTASNTTSPVLLDTSVVDAVAGYAHTLFLKADGSCWAIGNNMDGQLGDGTSSSRSTPVLVSESVNKLAAGASHSVIVRDDGVMLTFGHNRYGQLGASINANELSPVPAAVDVLQVAAGIRHTLFTVDQDIEGVHAVEFELGANGDRVWGGMLKQYILPGSHPVEPIVSAHEGWGFVGWDTQLDAINGDVTVTAKYLPLHKVYFDLAGKAEKVGGGPVSQHVLDGYWAVPPNIATGPGWEFIDWSTDTGTIDSDITVAANLNYISTDSDGDNLPDWWEIHFFDDILSHDGQLDSDDDGESDWREYVAGTDPLNASDWLRISNCEMSTASDRIDFQLNTNDYVPGRMYRIYYSEDLSQDTWQEVLGGPFVPGPGDYTNVSVSLPVGFESIFLHAKVFIDQTTHAADGGE